MTDREAGAVHEQRELLVEEIRTAERARELLVGLEQRLNEGTVRTWRSTWGTWSGWSDPCPRSTP